MRKRHSEVRQEIMRSDADQTRIDSALSIMATRVRGVLTERMVEMWHRDLDVYPTDAIEWAMDSYGRNAKRLPALADITALLSTWQSAGVQNNRCELECQQRHGRGYSGNDVDKLFKLVVANGGKFKESMLDEIDKIRGTAPEWRQPA